MTLRQTSLGLSVAARTDGTLEAAYIQLGDDPVARTEEAIEAVLLLDFDAQDNLVGVEILAPVRIEEVIRLADQLQESQREAFRQFVRSSAPPDLITP